MVAVVALVLSSLVVMGGGSASAGPSGSSCSMSVKGCTEHPNGSDRYQFNSNDSNLSNNRYVTEFCGGILPPCLPQFVVQNNIGAFKKNSASYARMCVYGSHNYGSPLYWVSQTNVWGTTSSPHSGASLRYRTSSTC